MNRATLIAGVAFLGLAAFLTTAPAAQAQSGVGFKLRIGNVQIGGFKVDGDHHGPAGHYHGTRPVVVTPGYVPVRAYAPVHHHRHSPVVSERVLVTPEPVVVVPVRHYHVLFRTCDHEPWREYGSYRSHGLAHDVVDGLRHRGYEARVVHH